jgi:LuxR family maltose regulon positive regulatory protein
LVDRLRTHRGPVLVAAPAGYGKSTVLAQWLRTSDRTFAWVSLDEGDNDPLLFWSYVIEAIRAVEPRLSTGIPSTAATREHDVVAVIVPRLLNELEALAVDVVLVLDDYHSVTSPACHEAVELFLAREPAKVRLVISTRTDPPIAIGRRRAVGDLLELRAADLRFSDDESRRLVNDSLGLGLSPQAVATLQERAEGWPAGLYLACLSLRDAADREQVVAEFRGSNRHVGDYLTEVVLDTSDPQVRDFLLETSILDRMCGSLCDATTGRTGSGELLVELEHANLFLTPLDDRREWYRYHHLFGDLLRAELHRRSPDRVADLHRQAFGWLAAAGQVGEGIRHAIAARELDAASRLVAEHYLPTIEWGGYATVAGWLEAFPRRAVTDDARLSVVEAWVMSFLMRRHEAGLALQNALKTGYEGTLPDGASSVEASAALLRAGFPWGEVGAMLVAARRAFELEGDRDSLWRVTVHIQLGWALSLAGRFDEARPFLERGAALAPLTEQWLNELGAHCVLAWLDLEAGDLVAADRRARDAIDVLEAHGLTDTAVAGYAWATLGAVRARADDLEEGRRMLSLGVDRMRSGTEPLLVIQGLLALASVHRALGSAGDGRRALAEAATIIHGCTDAGVLGRRYDDAARQLAGRAHLIDGGAELTKREVEILRLLATRLSQREIGRELFVSHNTVHSHVRSIYRKLGASTRSDAVSGARELGLLWGAGPESPG